MLICLCENHNINILLIQHFPAYLRMGSKVFFLQIVLVCGHILLFQEALFYYFPNDTLTMLHTPCIVCVGLLNSEKVFNRWCYYRATNLLGYFDDCGYAIYSSCMGSKIYMK
jgi:hypothetical protein